MIREEGNVGQQGTDDSSLRRSTSPGLVVRELLHDPHSEITLDELEHSPVGDFARDLLH
jgi:hypothetical protein